jgi:multiple sugar transport system permease protein
MENNTNGQKYEKLHNRIGVFIKKNYTGYLYISPVLLGILFFTIVPMLISVIGSFFDFKLTNTDGFVNFGFQNFSRLFNEGWRDFAQSLKVTSIYAVINIPLTLFLSFALAMFLNQDIKGMKFFRVLYYAPVLIPAVVSGLVWMNITNVRYGIANSLLEKIGLEPLKFFSTYASSMPTFILMGLFSIGGSMILWLAQLKNVPTTMYESAKIEGAGFWIRTLKITIPMCTPMIFYNLIMSVITILQTFSSAYVVQAAPDSLLFYVVNIYNEAFLRQDMGYACVLSWALFIIIGLLTLLVFKTNKWVFYGEES